MSVLHSRHLLMSVSPIEIFNKWWHPRPVSYTSLHRKHLQHYFYIIHTEPLGVLIVTLRKAIKYLHVFIGPGCKWRGFVTSFGVAIIYGGGDGGSKGKCWVQVIFSFYQYRVVLQWRTLDCLLSGLTRSWVRLSKLIVDCYSKHQYSDGSIFCHWHCRHISCWQRHYQHPHPALNNHHPHIT